MLSRPCSAKGPIDKIFKSKKKIFFQEQHNIQLHKNDQDY